MCTRHATCRACNNHFATADGDKIDDALAEAFVQVRCALMIWSGRNNPPPTLVRVGQLSDGLGFDLAPGFVAVVRQGRVPVLTDIEHDANAVTVNVRDDEDARRIRDILQKRGLQLEVHSARRIVSRPPWIKFRMGFHNSKTWRAAAKTAVLGACVLYGNEGARKAIEPSLLAAIKSGHPDIRNYACWDYTNAWPKVVQQEADRRTPHAKASGFEHLLILADVGEHWIAYLEFFRGFRISVRLGPKSAYAIKGLALNPRAGVYGRFRLSAIAPEIYRRKRPDSFKEEHEEIVKGTERACTNVLAKWENEAVLSDHQDLVQKLQSKLEAVGDDEDTRAAVITKWAAKIAELEFGETWSEDLDKTFLEGSEDITSNR